MSSTDIQAIASRKRYMERHFSGLPMNTRSGGRESVGYFPGWLSRGYTDGGCCDLLQREKSALSSGSTE